MRRRWSARGMAVFVVALAWPATTYGQTYPEMISVTVNGAPAPFSPVPVATIHDDVDASPNYIATNFNPLGGRQPAKTASLTGTSAAEFVRLAGVDPATLSGDDALIVSKVGQGEEASTPIALSSGEVVDGFANVLDPARERGQAVFYHGSEIGTCSHPWFARPMRSQTDVDTWLMAACEHGGTLAVALKTATGPLTVRATATPLSVKVGEPVVFSAQGGAAGWTYKWTFGDGATAGPMSLSSTTHTFSDAGRYQARVTVSDGASSGVSRLVTVEVTADVKQERTSTPTPTPTPTATSPPRQKVPQNDQTGGGAGKRDAVTSGPRTSDDREQRTGNQTAPRATRMPVPKGDGSGQGHGDATVGGGGGGAGGGSNDGGDDASGAGAGTSAPDGTGDADEARRSIGTAGSTAQRHDTSTRSGSERHAAQPGTAAPGIEVKGVLLGDDGKVVTLSRTSTATTRGLESVGRRAVPALRAGAGSSTSTLGVLAGVLGVVLLVALGGVREELPVRRRRVWQWRAA